jgi:predicted nucleic acid-binding protein
VIYVDSSVALARLFGEPRSPPALFWAEPLISSKLLEYEVLNQIHAYGLVSSHGNEARALLAGVEMIEMTEVVLARALTPFPVAVRTLDALHLATAEFLRAQGEPVELASNDNRLIAAAQAMSIPLAALTP